jgi:hypothetical protein
VVERTATGWRLAGDADEPPSPARCRVRCVGLTGYRSARRTLQAAVAIGRTFDQDVLLAVAGGHGDLHTDLLELQQRDLIRVTTGGPRPSFTFRHALTQEAAYDSMLVKRRRALHLRVAEALEAANGERLEDAAPSLARHFGEAGVDEATLKYAAMAGDAAARLYANAEAEAHYRVGIDVARRIGVDPTLLRSLYERRGNALELAARHDDAIGNYEEMRSVAVEIGDELMELGANTAIALLYSTATPLFDPERGRRLSEANVAWRAGSATEGPGTALWSSWSPTSTAVAAFDGRRGREVLASRELTDAGSSPSRSTT